MDLKEKFNLTKNKRHPWELSRAVIVSSLLEQHLSKDKTVLDIGCGDLFFDEFLLSKYDRLTLHCVDTGYSQTEICSLNSKDKKLTIYNNLEDFQKKNIKVDILLLMDVIEHIEKDDEYLQMLISSGIITAETIVLITVPAFACLYTSHDDFLNHYRRYNLTNLKELLNVVDLKLINCGYFYFSLLFPRFLQKTSEYLLPFKSRQHGSLDWNGGNFLTSLLTNVLIMDFKISKFMQKIGIIVPGLSVYASATIKGKI